MAKMKKFAVEVEITTRRTVYVTARRPNGAIERLRTEEGWREAIAYQEDDLLDSIGSLVRPGSTQIITTNVREV